MNPEEKNGNGTKDFGKVVDALHNKSKLSALRSYQGDMAEFIKEKNESVISIAVKEKERKQEREEKELEQQKIEEQKEEKEKIIVTPETIFHAKPKPEPRAAGNGLQINIVMILVSILLLGGGGTVAFYAYQFLQEPGVAPIIIDTEIIPYNVVSTIANVSNGNIGSELQKLPAVNGITVVKISGPGGQPFQNIQDFFGFLEIVPPNTLARALKDEYAMGIFSQGAGNAYFIVLSVNDFGRAFAGMLEWESTLAEDLAFLEDDPRTVPVPEGHPLASTSKPVKQETYTWKDIIVKNKDTRGLVNSKNQSRIAYTFLDKNTILITNNVSIIGDFASIYASRSVVR